jgi:hypothetical protein
MIVKFKLVAKNNYYENKSPIITTNIRLNLRQ